MGSALTEQLESLVQDTRNSSAPEFKVALSRLATELKQRFSNGSPSSFDFVTTAVRALSKIKGTAHAEIRMSCLFDSGAFLFANRYDAEALDCARQLNQLAKQAGNKFWLRKAYMLQGIAFSHIGDLGEAVLQYTKALEMAREAGEPQGEVAVLSNLGTTLNYAGLYREAIPCLSRAIVLAKEGFPSYEASALCNIAQSYLHLGEYELGLKTILECLERSDEPTDAFSALARSVREMTLVQLALELGKLQLARNHSKLCFQYSQRSGTKRGQFLADLSRGLCEIHGGDVDKGLTILEKALEASGQEGTAEYVEALRALVRGYDYAARPEEALVAMNSLLKTIRESRAKSIAALVSFDPKTGSFFTVASEASDLQEFRAREAQLRAQVAEREVINSRVEMFERLAVAADLKEEASGEHGYRVGKIASLVAFDLKWDKEACYALELASRLHDLGKIAVPDRILLSSQTLKDAERHFISAHTLIGAELLAKSNIPQLRMAEEIARCHHEWWNGEGYPAKLAGKRIPIHARIVALADVFDALTHGRPFSSPWPMDRAIEEIRSRKGTQFDPELTDIFLDLIQRLRAEHADLDEYLGRAGRNSPFLQARRKIRLMLAEEREHEKMATVEGNETRH